MHVQTTLKGLEDWTFKDANTQEHIHVIHPYPARMIPQIARRLIEKYSERGAVVLDPFCGSGSVLAEAKILRRHSVGIDINPLACLIAKVKTTPISPKILNNAFGEVRKKLKRISVNKEKLPRFYNVNYWFKAKTVEELTAIKNAIDALRGQDVRDFFYVCFSKTVRSVSLCRSGEYKLYRMSEEEIKRFNPDAFKEFIKNVKAGIEGMREFYARCEQGDVARSIVIRGNSRRIPLKSGSVDLIVTSPPYGDSRTTVAYGQFSRYSSLWLGFEERDVRDVDKASLGGAFVKFKSRNVRSKILDETLQEIVKRSVKRAEETEAFFSELWECLSELSRVLRENGYACIVIGNRTVSRVKMPTDQIIMEMGNELGLEHVRTYYRRIPTKCIPWANAPENIAGLKCETIANESIIVLKA
ncbi:DNA methyltransferase [Candidatus Alkanophaga liquidiphilum]